MSNISNTLYDLGREAFLEGSIAYLTDTIKVALVNTSYSFSNSHQFWSSVSANVVGTPQALASKSGSAGVANAANVTFSAVSGSQVGSLVIYKDTGSAATSPLIAFIDTATGLPVTPNGGDISISWDTGSNKIWKL